MDQFVREIEVDENHVIFDCCVDNFRQDLFTPTLNPFLPPASTSLLRRVTTRLVASTAAHISVERGFFTHLEYLILDVRPRLGKLDKERMPKKLGNLPELALAV